MHSTQGNTLDLRRVRRLGASRRIVARWRDLTRGGRTLVACSGGADSSALLLALAASERERLAVGHVVHDMRERSEALADRDAVRALAETLRAPFVEAEAPMGEGNIEAALRRARYRALAGLARANGCGFVVTGHSADDQLETVVMALARGSGLRGLRGAAETRSIGDGVTLARPMLGVTRDEAERVCAVGGVSWRTDSTNADTTRLRAALRAGPLRDLLALRPAAARRAAESAALVRDAQELVEARAHEVFGDGFGWPRAALRAERAVVVGEGLRSAAVRLREGKGADRLTARVVRLAVEAVRDEETEPRVFEWAGGVRVEVTARDVRVVRPEVQRGAE